MSMDISSFEVESSFSTGLEQEVNASPAKEEYKKCLARNLFGGKPLNNRVLAIGARSPASTAAASASASNLLGESGNSLRLLYVANRNNSGPRREAWGGRHIPQSPERILDAPELLDDYYLNLLDWNADNILGGRRRSTALKALDLRVAFFAPPFSFIDARPN